MTTENSAQLADVLRIYEDHPLQDGDAVLLLDSAVCLEVEGLADQWDEQLRSNTAGILRETARTVLLAVARPGAALLPSDYQVWRDLHTALRDGDVALLPLRALPAA
ncbi:MAG: hypothetical protein JWN77_81 [Frankiales bacterium]|jgi:hypothetical protein|nr:hypothetical protein [Frankiales bacterium]